MKITAIIFVFLLMGVVGVSLSGLTFEKTQYDYVVYLEPIPTHIDPFLNQVNANQYIISQIYFPLLELEGETGEILRSRFLDTETLYNRTEPSLINFCLKEGLRFSDNQIVTINDLESSLDRIRKAQPENVKFAMLKSEGRCLTVKIAEHPRQFLNKFLSSSTTIVQEGNLPFPIGLGPFRFVSWTEDEIKLTRGAGSKSQVQNLYFRHVRRQNETLNTAKTIVDLNHVFTTDLKHVERNITRVNWPIKKTYVLGVFHKNFKLRNNLITCLRAEDLTSLVPIRLSSIPGYLPKGILGWDVSLDETLKTSPSDACDKLENQFIELFVYSPSLLTKFQSFSDEFFRKTKFRFKIREVSLNETIKSGFSGVEFASIIGFDTSGSINSNQLEPAVFFESFYRKPWLGPGPIQQLESLVSQAIVEPYGKEKISKYKMAHKVLLEARYVLPIGEALRTQLYDCRIKNIKFKDEISGTLDFDSIEIGSECE